MLRCQPSALSEIVEFVVLLTRSVLRFDFCFLLTVKLQVAWSQTPKSAQAGNLPQLSTVLHFFEVALLPGQWHGRTLILLILVFVQWAALVPLLQEVASCKHKLEYFLRKKESKSRTYWEIQSHTVSTPQCLDSGISHLRQYSDNLLCIRKKQST